MKNKVIRMLLIMTILLSLQSCSIIKGIFKAGVGVGIVVVVFFIAIIIFVVSKLIGKK